MSHYNAPCYKVQFGYLDLGVNNTIDIFIHWYLIDLTKRHWRKDGYTKVSAKQIDKHIKKFAKQYSLDFSTIYKVIKRLEKKGLIEIIHKGFGEFLLKVYSLYDLFSGHDYSSADAPDPKSEPESPEPKNKEAFAKRDPDKTLLQQQLIRVGKELSSIEASDVSLKDRCKWLRLYGEDAIVHAVDCIRDYRQRNKVGNPAGLLFHYLKKGIYKTYKFLSFLSDRGGYDASGLFDWIDIQLDKRRKCPTGFG